MTERMLKGLRSALNWNRANGRNGVVIRLKELEALIEIAEREQWTRTEDKLPDRDCYCLCFDGLLIRLLFFHSASEAFTNIPEGFVIDTKCITHWMYLTEPPREVRGNHE